MAGNARLLSALFAIGFALTGKLAEFAGLRRQFDFVGDENGQALLDGEVAGAPGADEVLLITAECGFSLGIEWTTELCEEGVVHVAAGVGRAEVEKQKTPDGLLRRGSCIDNKLVAVGRSDNRSGGHDRLTHVMRGLESSSLERR